MIQEFSASITQYPQSFSSSGTTGVLNTSLFGSSLVNSADAAAARSVLGLTSGTQEEIETGTETGLRSWSPSVLKASILAVSPTPTLTDLGGTTVGQSLFTLTNPDAVTFLRINANNTASLLSAADTRTALGGTTAGQELFQLTTPAEASYLRVNADGTVSVLTAAQVWTALGGSGTIGSPSFATVTLSPATAQFLQIIPTTGFDAATRGMEFGSNYAGLGANNQYLKPVGGALATTFWIPYTNFNVVGNTLQYGNIVPNTTNIYDLGSSSKVWRAIYAGNLTASGWVKTGSMTVAVATASSSATAVAAGAGARTYISNPASGTPQPAWSDGTIWRFADGTPIS